MIWKAGISEIEISGYKDGFPWRRSIFFPVIPDFFAVIFGGAFTDPKIMI